MCVVDRAAGFWRRLGASVIDALVLGVADTILRVVLGVTGSILGILLSLGYFTYFHGTTGQTPGNAVLGIRVVDIDNGEPIGYQRAAVRWVVSIVSGIVVVLGFLWMLWDERKQTWHDKAAGSLPIHPA